MNDLVSRFILSFLVLFPILSAGLIVLIPTSQDCVLHRRIALWSIVLEFVASLHLVYHFVSSSADVQFAQSAAWLPDITGIRYTVGIDGLSLALVLLTTVFFVLAVITSRYAVKSKVKGFLALLLLLESSIIGVFVSFDIVLFYVFWELSLVPAYFMIGLWGGAHRAAATLKMFLYGAAGSLFMLAALIYLYCAHGRITGVYSGNLLDLYQTAIGLSMPEQTWLFLSLCLSFAIKAPLFPFYSWLPDAYEQAPSIYPILSGVILKLATYGFIRFALCLFPAMAVRSSFVFMLLGVISILYGALLAWRQTQLGRMMAFSSISHIGFIILGIFSLQQAGLQGAFYQMLNHAMTAGALFILFNALHEKTKSLHIDQFGGLASLLPWYSFFFVVACFGAVALPGTGSFLGEWLVLFGAFQASPVLGALATLGVVFGAIYMLWLAHKVVFGPLVHTSQQKWADVRRGEWFQLAVLSCGMVIFGFAFQPIMRHAQPTLVAIEQTLLQQKPYHARLMNLSHENLLPIIELPAPSSQPSVQQEGGR